MCGRVKLADKYEDMQVLTELLSWLTFDIQVRWSLLLSLVVFKKSLLSFNISEVVSAVTENRSGFSTSRLMIWLQTFD